VVRGLAAAPGTAAGTVRRVQSLDDAGQVGDGDVLVAHEISPDWLPLMRRVVAVVTDSGGKTCHAAMVCRELAIPCIVGAENATSRLRDGQRVLVDATAGIVSDAGSAAASCTRAGESGR
jgi:pyruvate, water dikinase